MRSALTLVQTQTHVWSAIHAHDIRRVGVKIPQAIPTKSRELVAARERRRCLRCGAPAQAGEWHHRRGRSVRDAHTHCACNGVWLCNTCHAQVHAEPFIARMMGWIVHRNEAEPGTVPVSTWYGVLLLQCDGGIEFTVEERDATS